SVVILRRCFHASLKRFHGVVWRARQWTSASLVLQLHYDFGERCTFKNDGLAICLVISTALNCELIRIRSQTVEDECAIRIRHGRPCANIRTLDRDSYRLSFAAIRKVNASLDRGRSTGTSGIAASRTY